MLNNIDKDTFIYGIVAFIGFAGGVLGIGSGNTKIEGENKAGRAISVVVAIGSAMLFCLAVHEIVLYFSGTPSLGVALGGIAAWFGANFMKTLTIKLINSLISALVEFITKIKTRRDDYSYGGSEYEYKDIVRPRNETEDMNKTYKELE
ncbi:MULTISPECIES: hypothetical protein [unclassified Campylobacter]|uniref:hypothetical protein n=1 Tax=unclassified Campylobacter TaxID=2593542 RepID=UPI001475291B|nr:MULTISPECIES: hypothetical protein [unclassified Campylobacter]